MNIIHSFDYKKVLSLTNQSSLDFFLIDLEGNFFLDKKNKNVRILGLESLTKKEQEAQMNEYLGIIGKLGRKNKSIVWWANAVSEKNEYTPVLYKDLCVYFCLVKTIKKYFDKKYNVIIVCKEDFLYSLKDFCLQNNISFKTLEKDILISVDKTRKLFYKFLQIIFFVIKLFFRKVYIDVMLNKKIQRLLKEKKDVYVIRTWVDNRFLSSEIIKDDPHFGSLPQYIVENGKKLFILAGITNSFFKIIKKIKKDSIFVIPEEYFLKYTDIFSVIKFFPFKRSKAEEKIYFNQTDVTLLVESTIRSFYFTSYFFFNIAHYVIGKRFGEKIGFESFIYTFENYAWEKMTLLGLKEVRDRGAIYGFQHAYISRNSFKYFPDEMEKDIIPLPDKIITMGSKTKEIMEKYGNYPDNIFKIGCALRQEYLKDTHLLSEKRFDRILIPLTMVNEDSLKVIKFLCSSFIPQKINVVIRCHPVVPFSEFRNDIDFDLPENLTISKEKDVKDDLLMVDMVFYTWTTVAIEALWLGLPIIYLDLLSPMNVDPLFECNYLKKSVKKPDELCSAISHFYNMKNGVLQNERKMAAEYLKEYFYPVNEENLVKFLNE